MAIGNVRDARRLRGRPVRGVAGLRGMAVPVLQTALDRSLHLASSMDARGYGRRVAVAPGARRVGGAATACGLLAVIAGVYGALDTGSLPAGGIPFLAVGAALLAGGMLLGGRRSERTRYRPDRWGMPEWLVAASGSAALVGLVVASALGVAGIQQVLYPLTWPTLPLLPTVGILAGLLPAAVAPVDPSLRPMHAAGPAGTPVPAPVSLPREPAA